MDRSYSGSRVEQDALNTYLKLVRAAERISTAIHQHLAADGLSNSQFAVLEALYHLGPLCQKDLGSKILKSAGNMTTVIGNLEKDGLVKRLKTQDDRRFYTITLSANGEELIRRIFPRHVRNIVQEFSPLTSAEQHELARLCRKLGVG